MWVLDKNVWLSVLITVLNVNDFVTCQFLCSSTIPAVAPDPLSLEKIVKFLEAEMNGVRLFDELVESELNLSTQAFTTPTRNTEDIHSPMDKLVTKYGFKIQFYEVTTEDGYILGIYRIPNDGPAVLFLHGACGSSEDFITPGPDDSMAYALSRAGYDIFFINYRGNKFSNKHKTLSPKCAEYWDFSFHEIGKYDIPATIDFILNLTGEEKVSLIGWSQGTTTFFIMASIAPEYNDKVSVMIALSPVTYLSHCLSPIARLLAFDEDLAYVFLSAIGINNILPNDILNRAIIDVMCAPNPISKLACSSLSLIAFGYDSGKINTTNLPVEMGHYPSGCSTKIVIHYTQSINTDKFSPFDYGKTKNNEVYGTDVPPEYPLEKVTAPVALFHGTRDWLAVPEDVEKLKCRLPNVVDDYTPENYNHVDYVWGSDVNTVITKRMLSLLDKYK